MSGTEKKIKVALVGNPNTGKSTLFNVLTGLHQKTGNFPGVTVDKKTGYAKINDITLEIVDLPGAYSLYPKSIDEAVTYEVLCDNKNPQHPDLTILVADADNLKRSLFLCSQVIDLKIPLVIAVNMIDLAAAKNIELNVEQLSKELGVPVFAINARDSKSVGELKKYLSAPIEAPQKDFLDSNSMSSNVVDEIKKCHGCTCNYQAYQMANNCQNDNCHVQNSENLLSLIGKHQFDTREQQAKETVLRYQKLASIISKCVKYPITTAKTNSQKIDDILTHRIFGYVIFLFILFLIFQSVFTLASFPMDFIETTFLKMTHYFSSILPPGILTDLFINGILAGLSGVVVFVPQIAMLFAFIAVLEDTGYMARVSFIMDRMMRKFGLNGRSVIPLISGVACAVPAIMSTRTISNWKERMITIMVTPLMSCSARLPVFTLLISLVIPADRMWGVFNLQGITMMGLYLLGAASAIVVAFIISKILKSKEKSYFIMEMPVYRAPQWKVVGLTILDKVKIFLRDAGKVIIAISVLLWFLSSFAPGNKFEQIEKKYNNDNSVVVVANNKLNTLDAQEKEALIASEKLESSYAGIIGKTIEPAIRPLGFDWKIGISLITSFAAREVFVGTMATIYSVGDKENTTSIRQKMDDAVDSRTGAKTYTFAVGISLLLFYVFAMQCVSTIAVVYRETKHWKWAVIQFVYMGCMAYLASFIAYSALS